MIPRRKNGQKIVFRLNLNPNLDANVPPLSSSVVRVVKCQRSPEDGGGSIIDLPATLGPGEWEIEAAMSVAQTTAEGLWGATPWLDYGGNRIIPGDTVNFRIDPVVTFR